MYGHSLVAYSVKYSLSNDSLSNILSYIVTFFIVSLLDEVVDCVVIWWGIVGIVSLSSGIVSGYIVSLLSGGLWGMRRKIVDYLAR